MGFSMTSRRVSGSRTGRTSTATTAPSSAASASPAHTDPRRPLAPTGPQSTAGRARVPGLDGIRALAALFVLGYHLLPGAVPAGFAGVDVFFVLSGFLITSMLVDQLDRSGRIDLPGFWLRRVRRLLPAVAVTCIGASALALAVGGDALVGLPRQVLGALTATYNWAEIGAGSSYFEQSSPLLLTNVWSLAVEQQFYLVWPLIAVLLMLRLPRCRVLVTGLIGAVSVGLHLLYASGDVSRAYMGTDSHLWGLMIGAAVAFTVPWALRSTDRRHPHAVLWGSAGVLGFVLTLALLASLPESVMYPWGMLAVSATIAVTIRSLIPDVSWTGPAHLLAEVLETRPLVWLGERSYGIYLWHWPLGVLMFYSAPLLDVRVTAAVVLVASILLAAASYRFVETPIRRLGFRGAARRCTDWLRIADLRATVAAGTASVLLLGSAGWALAVAPDRSSAEIAVAEGAAQAEIAAPGTGAGAGHDESSRAEGEGDGAGTQPSDAGTDGKTPSAPSPRQDASSEPGSPTKDPAGEEPRGKDDPPASAADEPRGKDDAPASGGAADSEEADPTTPVVDGSEITVIGDSLTVASQGGLQDAYPGIAIDAEVSRSILKAPETIAAQEREGQLRTYVVVALSTNSVIRDSDIDRIEQEIGPDRQLILVTGFGPARTTWVPPANEAIHRAADRYDNVHVADWNAAISGRTDLLAGDAVHPAGPEGVRLYVRAITEALNDAAAD